MNSDAVTSEVSSHLAHTSASENPMEALGQRVKAFGLRCVSMVEVTPYLKNQYLHYRKSASSGFFIGGVAAYCLFGSSIIVVPAFAIVGAIVAVNLNGIKKIAHEGHRFSTSWHRQSLENDIRQWREKDEDQKQQLIKAIEKHRMRPRDVFELMWSLPPSQEALAHKYQDKDSYSLYEQVKNYVGNTWETTTLTTLRCAIAGAVVFPLAMAFLSCSVIPKPLIYLLGIPSTMAIITYSIPAGIVLGVTYPLIKKLYNKMLMTDAHYRATYYQHKDLQAHRLTHQHWTNELSRRGLHVNNADEVFS